MNFVIIGESVLRLDSSFVESKRHMEWHKIKGFRNLIALSGSAWRSPRSSYSVGRGALSAFSLRSVQSTFYRNEIDYSGKREGISRTNIYTNHAGLIPSLCYPIGYFYK